MAAAFRATDQARIWEKAGHEVTVFTVFPNYPIGRIYDGYKARLLSEEIIDGIRVLRSKIFAVPNKNLISRLKNVLSGFFFGVINLLINNAKIGNQYDVVLGTSGDIFTGLLAWIYAFFHKKPLVFEIRDITYRQMQATGKGEKSLGVLAMRWLELFLCKRAQKVVVVTDGFKRILEEDGIPGEKISVITNGVDIEGAGTVARNQNHLVLSYFGTLGISQNIGETFPYANAIRTVCEKFTYLIIGEGAQRTQIEDAVNSGKYPYVELMHGMPMKDLEAYYSKTALSVITLRKSDNFRYTLPSKLFQVMGRGIAVLFIGPDGEAAEIVRKYHAGLALTGTQEEDISELRRFFERADWQAQLTQMGKNGAAAVKDHYSRKTLAENYIKLFEECASVAASKS